MTRTFCDDCGEQLGGWYPHAEIPAPFLHPENGGPFVMRCDFCAFCCSKLLAAYAKGDSDGVAGFWAKVADREGWEIPWETLVSMAYDGVLNCGRQGDGDLEAKVHEYLDELRVPRLIMGMGCLNPCIACRFGWLRVASGQVGHTDHAEGAHDPTCYACMQHPAEKAAQKATTERNARHSPVKRGEG